MFKKSTQRAHYPKEIPNSSIPMMFSLNMKPANVVAMKPKPVIHAKPSTTVSQGTMTWGKPIWYFLHCLAANIKENIFLSNRTDVLKVIYLICTNLPCHLCSDHAKNYLDSINFNNIKTKTDLIYQLFLFHNSVNARKGYPLFDESNLKKYDDVAMQRVVSDFLRAYNQSSRLNIYSFSRQSTINYVRGWLHSNYNNL